MCPPAVFFCWWGLRFRAISLSAAASVDDDSLSISKVCGGSVGPVKMTSRPKVGRVVSTSLFFIIAIYFSFLVWSFIHVIQAYLPFSRAVKTPAKRRTSERISSKGETRWGNERGKPFRLHNSLDLFVSNRKGRYLATTQTMLTVTEWGTKYPPISDEFK